MTHRPQSPLREPSVSLEHSLADVTAEILAPLSRRPGGLWWAAFSAALAALALGICCVVHLIRTGIGVWGLNNTVGWGFDITSFVFWVGIGHAGTLISAILFLFRQKWRTAVNRSAEAMTLFAVCCAGIFPIIHMGRPWLAFWSLPYPNTRGSLWVNFRSPLLWDVFAISTYFTISAVFWYVGLLPDLATARDRTTSRLQRRIYGLLSLGWNGSHRAWLRYETVYMLLAALATPLVISVHTVVSMDFATAVLLGWHATIFPPYFVAGAVFSGFAMVLTLTIVMRKVLGWEHVITVRHLENMAKVIIVTGGIVALAYGTELLLAWYSASPFEQFAISNRMFGPYAWAYWTMVACNVVSPQLLWLKRVRTSPIALFAISLVINVGMWFERFVIIVTSLHRDLLPSSWAMYAPTWVEVGTLIGSFGLFFTLFLLFTRTLPMVSIAEVKGVLAEAQAHRHGAAHAAAHRAEGDAACGARVRTPGVPMPGCAA